MGQIKNLSLAFLFLTLLGTGCVAVDTQVLSPEEAALSLSLTSETELTLRETVLGVGGKFVTFFKHEEADRSVMVNEWTVGQSAKLKWQRELKAETEASKLARQDYYAKFAAAPIGSELPDPPPPVYEITVQAGTLVSASLAEASKILLPIFWEVGKESGADSTLIWLSKKQYDELIVTRRTQINLGLFDDSVSYAVGLTDQVKTFIERIKGSDVAAEEKSILEVNADIDWTNYTLSVDGKPTVVRAIHAQNAFARYTILANPENPLILELMLSPAARGSINLFSRKAVGDAFWGYEVTSFIRGENATPSVDQPPLSNP